MKLNGIRVRVLRQFHGMTQSELAESVAVSQPMIADYENGSKEPNSMIADALAAVLTVEPPFLYAADDERFLEGEYNFRRQVSATERLKKKVAAQAALFGMVVRGLRQYVPTMPSLRLPHFPATSDEEIERSAERAREFWGLGLTGPIDNMSRVLEHHGVVLTVADPDTAKKVDAFSRYGATSIVVLNPAKGSASRSFFDAAHEAAHGVLHFKGAVKSHEDREREADRFAGAFLMPRRPFTKGFWSGARVDWKNLLEIKREWGVSLAAIIVRAYELGLIDAAVYRTTFRDLSQRGWRTSEPEEPEPEQPELFHAAMRQYGRNFGRSSGDLALDLSFKPSLFSAVTGAAVVDSTGSSVVSLAERRTSRLRT